MAEVDEYCGDCRCPDTSVLYGNVEHDYWGKCFSLDEDGSPAGYTYPCAYGYEWHLEWRPAHGGCVCILYDEDAMNGIGGYEFKVDDPDRWLDLSTVEEDAQKQDGRPSPFFLGLSKACEEEGDWAPVGGVESVYPCGGGTDINNRDGIWLAMVSVTEDCIVTSAGGAEVVVPCGVDYPAWLQYPVECSSLYAEAEEETGYSVLSVGIFTDAPDPVRDYELFGVNSIILDASSGEWVTEWHFDLESADEIDYDNLDTGQMSIAVEWIDETYDAEMEDYNSWVLYHPIFDHQAPLFTNEAYTWTSSTVYETKPTIDPMELQALGNIYGNLVGDNNIEDILKLVVGNLGTQVALMSATSGRTFNKVRPTPLDDDVFDIFGDEQTEPTQSLTVSITGTY